ncbi:AsnC family transcriptional regulator [Streptomyces sp. CB01201]|uniref:AsnC family transcriptional regulator n=1 Tax=Streptomyces sp. CB01201 TaxID=2020324 RepID=UPI001F1C80BB|nr:AsnC family transcriptional regulator [Streptomyces sp. CB01201]
MARASADSVLSLTDQRLVAALQCDGRLTAEHAAQVLGLNPATVRRRLHALGADGTVRVVVSPVARPRNGARPGPSSCASGSCGESWTPSRPPSRHARTSRSSTSPPRATRSSRSPAPSRAHATHWSSASCLPLRQSRPWKAPPSCTSSGSPPSGGTRY